MLSVSLPLYLQIQSPYLGNGNDVLITLELCQLSDLVKTPSCVTEPLVGRNRQV